MNADAAVRNAITEPMTLAFDVTVTAVRGSRPQFPPHHVRGILPARIRGFGEHPGPAHQTHDSLARRRRSPTAVARLQHGRRRLVPRVVGDGSRGARIDADLHRAEREARRRLPGNRRRLRDALRRRRRRRRRGAARRHAADGGPAANWALAAKPGDSITIIGPNNRAAHCITAETYSGIEWRPGLAQRVLLAGDETAVPAISAILESLPAEITGHAFLEVPEAGDFQDIATDADIEITWLARGAAHRPVPTPR